MHYATSSCATWAEGLTFRDPGFGARVLMKCQVIQGDVRRLLAQIPLFAQELDQLIRLSRVRKSFAMTLVPCVEWTRSNFCYALVPTFVTFKASLL